jgi:hypothetical protein
VLFQPELTLEGLKGALNPLPEAAQRAVPAWLISAVGTQQARPIGGDQLLEVAAGEALIAQDDQPGAQPSTLVVRVAAGADMATRATDTCPEPLLRQGTAASRKGSMVDVRPPWPPGLLVPE